MKKILFLIGLCFSLNGTSQSDPADSLKALLSHAGHDTIKARYYSLLTECCELNEIENYALKTIDIVDRHFPVADIKQKEQLLKYKSSAISNLAYLEESMGNIEKGIKLYQDALKIREEIRDTAAAGNTLFNLANLYKTNSRIEEAIETNKKALIYFKQTDHFVGTAKTLFALAKIEYERGDLKKALELFDEALVFAKKGKSKLDEASILTGIGVVQGVLGNKEKELEYLLECEKIQKDIGDYFGLAYTYNNLGYLSDHKKDYKNALKYYTKSLECGKMALDQETIALAYHNMGGAWVELNSDSAIKYLNKSLEIKEKINDERGKALTLLNLGRLWSSKGETAKAKKLFTESFDLGQKHRLKDVIINSSESLSAIYAKEGNYSEAYRLQKLFKIYSDSLFNEQNHKASYKQQIKIEYEKKEAEAKLLAKLEKEQAASRARETQKRTNIVLASVTIVTLLILLLAAFIYKAYRQKKKANAKLEGKNSLIEHQKHQVEEQKELIEEKQKEILDSIHYAKRIQNAILAKEEEILYSFPHSFLLYKPKDIVAGDFYFYESTKDHVFYAAADCTGHGVPGALVSVVCSNALTRCVKEFSLTDPAKILDKTRELVIDTFKKSGEGVKDGMDISLLVKNISSDAYTWAGANNPLWILKNNSGEYSLKEIKADKQAIGLTEKPLPFNSHSFVLSDKEWIILLTDGYADQFGGPKGKKYKYKQLIDLLLENAKTSPSELRSALDTSFLDWKGELEQVDDVCVIGIQHK